MLLMQFGDIFSWILWLLLLFVLSFFGPRLMLSQYLIKIEGAVSVLKRRSIKGKNFILKRISKSPDFELVRRVSSFLDFFVIEPVDLDPSGIVEKLEHVLNLSDERIKSFVREIAPKLDSEEQMNLCMGLSAAISLHQLAKIMRHYLELIKKTKNLQLALLIQMQLPLIDRISKALVNGTEALTNGWPIGDSIGPLIVGELIGNSKCIEKKETVICRKKIKGKDVILIKAKGPGGRVGKIGRVVEEILKKEKISKIITIDAAVKLEGERTGSIAEGIGVAIGGKGVDRAFIERIAVKKKIPLESIIIKMSNEEAIQPMKKEILNAEKKVVNAIGEILKRSKGKIMIVGVGNTCGIGNSKKEVEDAKKKIEKIIKIIKRRKRIEKEKRKWSLSRLFEI